MSKKRVSEDERIRRQACTELGGQLESLSSMVERCEVLAGGGDPIVAIIAAATLARANAQLGISLARVAKVETRHRSITDRTVRTAGKPSQSVPWGAGLNSRNSLPVPRPDPSINDAKRKALVERLDRLFKVQQDEQQRQDEFDHLEAAPGADPYAAFFTWTREDDEQMKHDGER